MRSLYASEDYAPYSIRHIMKFLRSEIKGIITFYVNIEKYEAQLLQLVVEIALIIIGVATGVLRLKKLENLWIPDLTS